MRTEIASKNLVVIKHADGHVQRRECDTQTDAKAFATYWAAQHPDALSIEVYGPGEPIVTFDTRKGGA